MDRANAPGKHLLLSTPFGRHGEHVEISRVTLHPGETAKRHAHDGGVAGYVLEGEIISAIEGEPEQHLCAGDAFTEPPGATVLRFDNASKAAPATFVLFASVA